ncbi:MULTISPECIES: GGDEF domain-containing protein [unclassified Rhizobium]|uniref:GGDEF domain-containing protein n=1 Tax=unclassified Rhizobium TaxID=2613769 RepID=UPI001ADC698C|nr:MULTISPECIES: GGDEF domain-containing protein [unclassified Rhizobium]MBO9096862.1 GGDEF domain-containing protein [Rhizobium sp. L58/93]MBO9167105.1 GGDEF domain-containing protein [Rhizobium sp. L245/93]QXZ88224.1 GGDEF domain-containing protein [Rhizobium sp. K1/93]QXZ94195.1 GGDEF domain-containing protein [Rhizobium sp. K15/93]QYA05707.1 GGDEF domain-containing protein [Rhizobium sp. B21/90]
MKLAIRNIIAVPSETSRARVAAGTFFGTLTCVLAAIYADSFNFSEMSHDHFRRALATDILLLTFVGGPFFYILLDKIRQLAITRRSLQQIASTDSLTAVSNRGAFVMLVEAYLDKANAEPRMQAGSLLIVDADHFKEINDTHGHQAGDHALKIIASTIQNTLKSANIVGRVGGEEFCVFLPKAREEEALQIAEDIRAGIYSIHFPFDTSAEHLSVSVGGVSFSSQMTYKEIFAIADQRLYEAKASGRNTVRLASLMDAA